MRAFQGQASDNVAIQRTVQQKELLMRELEETMRSSKVKSLREQLSTRLRALRAEISADRRAEAEKADAVATASALKQMDAERRPRRARSPSLVSATFQSS